MGESPGDRFRRIIKAWQEQIQGKQEPAVMYAPARPIRIDRPAPPNARALGPAHTVDPVAEQPVQQGDGVAVQVIQPALEPAARSEQVAEQPVQRDDGAATKVIQPRLESVAPVEQRVAPPLPGDTVPSPELVESASDVRVVYRSALPDTEPLGKPPPKAPSASAPILDKLKTPADARRFLERLRDKTDQIVQDYTNGIINQRQFQAIYSHYQRQRVAVEQALVNMPGSGAWRAAAIEGHTSFLRQQHAAQVLGYDIYETSSAERVAQVGDFDVDDTVLAPILDGLRSSAPHSPDVGTKRLEIEDGRWLCWAAGRYTVLMVAFSTEPAALQMQMVEDLNRDFEMVNEMQLSDGDTGQLALTFTNLWAFEQGPQES